jgi:hypothetical protein
MLTIVPIFLLLLSASIMAVIHLVRPKFAFFWLIAALGAVSAWLAVLISGLHLPQSLTLVSWKPESLYPSSPTLIQDTISWPFAVALTTLTLSVILTAVVHMTPADWRAWASSLALTAVGLLGVMAGNPLTVLLAWAALDLLELIILLSQVSDSGARERIIFRFAAGVGGIVLLLGAILQASSAGKNLAFSSIPPQASLLFMLAAALRLGALPLHLPFLQEPLLRRGLGTSLRLIPAAASLALLVRCANVGVSSSLSPWFLLLAGIGSLYGAWNWATSDDELAGRPYWVFATAMLGLSAAVRGQPAASLAWGLVCLFSGGLLFLNSVHVKNMWPFWILGLFGLSGLPFTPAWNGMQVYNAPHLVSLTAGSLIILALITLVTHALLLVGYVRHLLRPTIMPPGIERWVWLLYPLGLALLLITFYLVGWWARPAIKEVTWTSWAGGAAALLLAGLFWQLRTRQLRLPHSVATIVRMILSPAWFYGFFLALYRSLRSVIDWITLILEGEGGILWTLLLLALILSLLASQGLGG